MNGNLFGTVSSPSMANFAMQQIRNDNSDKYSKKVPDAIMENV